MAGLAELATKMRGKAARVKDYGNAAKQHVAATAVRHLVNITPVDTSQALSNWQVGLGFPAVFPVSAYFEGKGGSTKRQSAGAAYDEALAVINLSKPGQPIYLSNVLPYIQALDGGSSTQHPGGFVRASTIVGIASLRSFKFDWG
jgi:hypothetical protein